jgi:alpha-beta hydrolase superfamily lysophospholipase
MRTLIGSILRKTFLLCKRRPIMVTIVFLVALIALWLLSSFAVAYRLTRRPAPLFAEPAPTVKGWRIESPRLRTEDDQDIGCWFVEGPDDGPSVVLLHGNGESRGASLPLAELFAGQHCSVLMLSLRAHGDSSGERHDIGYSARHDVVAAVAFLERRRPGRPIIVQGISLGAAAAIFAAPELGTRVSGYILESPYRDLRTAVRNRTEAYLPPVLDRVAYCGLICVCPLVLSDVDRIAPIESIGAIPESVPVLLLAGSADDRSRPQEARDLYSRVASHGRLIFFEGARHESLLGSNSAQYREAVLQLLKDATCGVPEKF